MQIIGYGKNRKLWIATVILSAFAAALLVAARMVPGFALKELCLCNGQAEGVRTYGRVVA